MLHVFSRRSRWWLGVLQVVLLLVTLALPVAAANDPASTNAPQLIQLLRSYNLIKGDSQGNLNLDKPITRAEMITIMARAMGGEQDAELYKQFSFFNDSKGHWAQGYISWAYFKKLVKGDGNGNVRPNDMISYAEALTMIERVVGQEPTIGEWPTNVLLTAAELRIVPDGVTAANINDKAIRGLVFTSFATAITTVKNDQGKTVFQTYIDSTAPVISLGQIPAQTKEDTSRITGTAQDAVTVLVNGKAATLTNGTFSADVTLTMGANSITVVATDMAGNSSTQTFTVTRIPKVATLDISGPAKVRPNASATYTVAAKDGNGNIASLEGVTATVDGNIGTFNLTNGVLTASATPGKGHITVKAGSISKTIDVEVMGQDASAARLGIRQINSGLAVSFTKPMTVVVEVQDANGKLLDTDYGRPVSLSASGLAGLTVTPAVAYTDGGLATFTVTGSAAGVFNMTATSTNLIACYYTAEFATNLRVRLSSDLTTLTIGGTNTSARIRATLLDDNGNATTNTTGTDIYIQLSATGTDGSLTDPYLRIMPGTNNSTQSGNDGIFQAGAQGGTTTITGAITSGQRITVDPVSISATVPSIGSGSHWDLISYQPYAPGAQGNLYVRLADGNNNTIPGSYAFQLTVDTSNNDPKTNGIPAGVSITLGTTALTPISDGVTEGVATDSSDVIARTVAGMAALKISYNKSGKVYVTVASAPGTTTAYAPDGTIGIGAYPGVASKTYELNFSQTPTGVTLTVDSDGLGTGVGSGATSSGRAFTLHAYLSKDGFWTPGTTATVTLSKVSGAATNVPVANQVVALDGKADFTVYSNGTPGEDVYRVTANLAGNPQSNSVTLQVQNAAPLAPTLLAVRGTNNGIAGALNYIAPTDTGMEIELQAGDPNQHWAVVRVYAENGYSALFTSAPVDLTGPAPRVTIPKSSLPNGVARYQITLRNGYGESPRSLSSNQVTNAVVATNFAFTGAKYQRSTKILTVYGNGFTNALDTVNPALLTIRDASTGSAVSLAGAQVTVNSWSQLTVNLSGLVATTTTLENPNLFSGSDVTLTADAGWYVRVNGEQSAAISPGVAVGPMANIAYVIYDRVNSRLYLSGDGFNTVNFDLSKMKLQAAGGTDLTLNSFSGSRVNDNLWQVILTPAATAALDANGAYTLTTLDGWAYDGTWAETALPARSMYAQVQLTSVTYNRTTHTLTLNGSGFMNGTVTVGSLVLTDKDTNQTVTISGTVANPVATDGQIQITLDNAAYSILEDLTKFRTTDSIYLTATPGWFTNAAARQSAGVQDRTLRLSWQ